MRPPVRSRSPSPARNNTFVNQYFTGNTLPKGMGIQLPFLGSPKAWYGVNGLANLIIREAVARNNGVVRAPHSRMPLTHAEKAEVMRRTRINKRAVRASAVATTRPDYASRRIGSTQKEHNYHAGKKMHRQGARFPGVNLLKRRAGVRERPGRRIQTQTPRRIRYKNPVRSI
jgi:1,2-phenylacetyl-CoA epoxidase PaaB subunit